MPRAAQKSSSRKTVTREILIEAALALGSKQGWKAVTIRKLADSVGYASPVIYEYFANKEDILLEIARASFAKLESALQTHELSTGPEELAAAYWRFAMENGGLYRLMNNMDGALERPENLQNEAKGVCQLVTAAVGKWSRQQRTAFDSNEEIADELWAFLHGMITLHMDRAVQFSPARVIAAVSAYLEGRSRRN